MIQFTRLNWFFFLFFSCVYFCYVRTVRGVHCVTCILHNILNYKEEHNFVQYSSFFIIDSSTIYCRGVFSLCWCMQSGKTLIGTSSSQIRSSFVDSTNLWLIISYSTSSRKQKVKIMSLLRRIRSHDLESWIRIGKRNVLMKKHFHILVCTDSIALVYLLVLHWSSTRFVFAMHQPTWHTSIQIFGWTLKHAWCLWITFGYGVRCCSLCFTIYKLCKHCKTRE